MRDSYPFIRRRAFPRGVCICRAVVLCLGFGLLVACGGSRTGPGEPRVYRITDGACGDVVFVESLGVDSTSAFDTVEARKTEEYGQGDIMLEAYALEVVDERGNVPEPDFYALRVLEAGTELLVHSVSDVITTEGDLFGLRWCPD